LPGTPSAKRRKVTTSAGETKAVETQTPIKEKPKPSPQQQPKKVEPAPKAEVKPKAEAKVEAKKPAEAPKKAEAKKPAEVPKKPEPVTPAVAKAKAAPSGPPKGPQTLANGLVFEVVKAGKETAPKAVKGRRVQVRYEGRLASNGKRFDKGTIPFKLGAGEVIRGWDLGVNGMAVGEKRKLRIPPALAYGRSGAPPDIPPNATLAFEVELMKVM